MSFGPKSLVGLMFMLVGSAALLFSLYGLGSMAWLSATGEHATGTVSNFRFVSPVGRNRTYARTQVTFLDSNGREHVVETRFGLGGTMSGRTRKSHELGEQVSVLYPRNFPDEAIIVDGKTIFWHIIFVLFSSPFVAIGVWTIRKDRKEQREDGWSKRRF